MYGSLESCILHIKKKVNEQFRRKMNEDVNGNRKLFWKEVSNAKEGKVEICSRIRDANGRLAQGEDEIQRLGRIILKICIKLILGKLRLK